MAVNEIKISIDGLKVGMFVSRLDKPWIDTPFSIEGTRINSKDDIDILSRYSSFVFVDTDKGVTPEPNLWISLSSDNLKLQGEDDAVKVDFKKKKKNEYTKLKRVFYEIETSFEEELKTAKETKVQLEESYKTVLLHLSEDKDIDIEPLKRSIEASVKSILRNPSAFSLLAQLEKSDEYSYSHALSTSIWCAQFGRHLGLKSLDIEALALGGVLLDIGKVKLPNDLLNKTTEISPHESVLIRDHVDLGLNILAKSKSVSAKVLAMVASHHERFNGSGYPQGLTNENIPIFGRIAGIVDSYDAMTTIRPYSKNTMTPNDAINELYNMRDTSFQAELVEQFIQTVGLYPTGSLVELSSGQVAVVLDVNDLKRLYPTVMLILDKDKKPLQKFETINLSTSKYKGLMVEKALPQGAFGIRLDELFL